jgi:hypothetical protein
MEPWRKISVLPRPGPKTECAPILALNGLPKRYTFRRGACHAYNRQNALKKRETGEIICEPPFCAAPFFRNCSNRFDSDVFDPLRGFAPAAKKTFDFAGGGMLQGFDQKGGSQWLFIPM